MTDIAGFDAAVVQQAERETSELLSALIRIDTSNPPGDETRVAEFLAGWFARAGLEGEIVGESAERANFVLRISGARPGPTLLLLAHMDVVPAEAEHWSVPPFAGEIRDGYVWGRGAVDIKNLVAAHAVAARRLATGSRDFAGTVVYAATADEEEGTQCGARWLTQERPDLVRCDYLINEGGGEFTRLPDGRRMYELQTGEKGTAQFRLTIHGRAGHASVPLRSGNAVVGAADVIRALHDHQPRVTLSAVAPEYVALVVQDEGLRARLLDEGTARAALRELAAVDESVADALEPLYGITFAPTIVHSSSEAINVYPATAQVTVDCRLPAGWGEQTAKDEIEAALAGVEAQWDLEFVGTTVGNASPRDSALRDAIQTVLSRHVPDGVLAPAHCTGFTDSNWFRKAFPEVVAYGFGPFIEEEGKEVWPRYHNVDERIRVRDLAFQTLFAEQVALELLI